MLCSIISVPATPPPVQLDNLLPYGTQFGDEAAFLGDDDASLPITFPGTSIPFYGGREDIIYVCMILGL